MKKKQVKKLTVLGNRFLGSRDRKNGKSEKHIPQTVSNHNITIDRKEILYKYATYMHFVYIIQTIH